MHYKPETPFGNKQKQQHFRPGKTVEILGFRLKKPGDVVPVRKQRN